MNGEVHATCGTTYKEFLNESYKTCRGLMGGVCQKAVVVACMGRDSSSVRGICGGRGSVGSWVASQGVWEDDRSGDVLGLYVKVAFPVWILVIPCDLGVRG